MREDGVLRTIDASPVGAALLAYLGERDGFTGKLAPLLACLAGHRPPGEASWPKTAKGLGDALRRLAPALRMIGFNCTSSKKKTGIEWVIAKTQPSGDSPTAPSQTPQGLKASAPSAPSAPDRQKHTGFAVDGPVFGAHGARGAHGVGSRGAPKSEPPSFAFQGNDADDF